MKALELKTIICLWVYVSGSKAPLIRPDGLFGRGLSVDLPLLLLHPEASASETVVWDDSEGTPAFFAFFFLLVLQENHWQSILLFVFSKPKSQHVINKPRLFSFSLRGEKLGASCSIQ